MTQKCYSSKKNCYNQLFQFNDNTEYDIVTHKVNTHYDYAYNTQHTEKLQQKVESCSRPQVR